MPVGNTAANRGIEARVSRRRTVAFASVMVLAGALAGASPVVAQTADSSASEPSWAYELWHDVMSPYCPGRTLAECPSPQADELRLWILTQSAAGASREEVEASLYARSGDQIRTTPRAEGWGLAAYVIPVVAFVFFGVVVVWVLRRLVSGTRSPESGVATPSPTAAHRAPIVSPGDSSSDVDHTSDVDNTSDAELERRVDEELGA